MQPMGRPFYAQSVFLSFIIAIRVYNCWGSECFLYVMIAIRVCNCRGSASSGTCRCTTRAKEKSLDADTRCCLLGVCIVVADGQLSSMPSSCSLIMMTRGRDRGWLRWISTVTLPVRGGVSRRYDPDSRCDVLMRLASDCCRSGTDASLPRIRSATHLPRSLEYHWQTAKRRAIANRSTFFLRRWVGSSMISCCLWIVVACRGCPELTLPSQRAAPSVGVCSLGGPMNHWSDNRPRHGRTTATVESVNPASDGG